MGELGIEDEEGSHQEVEDLPDGGPAALAAGELIYPRDCQPLPVYPLGHGR